MCYVNLENEFSLVHWGGLHEYGGVYQALWDIWLSGSCITTMVCIVGKSNLLSVGVALSHICPLSQILFISFMIRIHSCSQGMSGLVVLALSLSFV